MKQPPPAMSWSVVVLVVIVLVFFGASMAINGMRTAECEAQGGTFMTSRGPAVCIKDGKIIIIWKLGGTVYNP